MKINDYALHSIEEIKHWLKNQRDETSVDIREIPISELAKWNQDEGTGNISHESGRFFSIIGLDVYTDYLKPNRWTQPIIKQDEIGILGIVTKDIRGVPHYLMQAKIEPGNINHVQLSPTIQATKSNYTQVHKGKKPTYLDIFLDPKNQVLFDQLQSEQGARFLRKRNRNILIKIDSEIEVFDQYRWMTQAQINELLQEDNLVNMDTRTVLSGFPKDNSPSSNYFIDYKAKYSFREIISWITKLKSKYELVTKELPLNQVKNWVCADGKIYHEDHKYFEVIGVSVEIEGREVATWNQPMIKAVQEGICAFLAKRINGEYHFLVQGKVECGNFDIIEMAPTVQCLTGNYKESGKNGVPFLDYVLNADKRQVLYDTLQSEEGGRFYKEQNRNVVVEVDEDFPVEAPEQFIWMTATQLEAFVMFNNYANIQTRSLMAAMSGWMYE